MEVQKLTRLGLMFMIVSLYLHGLITQFQLWCVVYYHAVITQTWLAGSHRRNHLRPDAQTTSIKSRWFYKIVRSTGLVDIQDHKSFHPRLANSSTTIFDLVPGQLGEHCDHFVQSTGDVEDEWNLNSDAHICNCNVKWLRLCLLHN